MTSASTKKWRRKGNEVVEAGRSGRRILMAVNLYPGDHASLDLAAAAPDMEREIQRLRTAMVHARDDAEHAGKHYKGRGMQQALGVIARRLKTALEKK